MRVQVKEDDPNQIILPGVQPVRLVDRLNVLAALPMQPKREQRPLDIGFWNPLRNQLELF